MLVELDDGIRNFIEDKMSSLDSKVYNRTEFDTFFTLPHRIFTDINPHGTIIAFCTLRTLDNGYQMCYSWCNETREGKKAYLKGIHSIIEDYGPISFAAGALKLNIIRRLKDAY